jgi:2-polyprenyl-3-methyl-5-hydroxy-6-metoxy-1,4-benzoquinol methylase
MTEHTHKNSDPSPFLVEHIDLLPRGRALDVAMGRGRNAVFLAGLGFETEGIDISTEAVRDALDLAAAAGVSIRAVVADLEKGYLFEKEAYDLIVCFNYLHRPLFQTMKDALKVGGMVVYETFIVDQALFGKPRNPDHLLKHNELLSLFREFRCLRYREGVIGEKNAIAGIVAKKTAKSV